jgi:hypothetical protein
MTNQTYPNGVYFGLEFEDYEKIERLSKSRLKQMLISPADFWADSWLNPNPVKLTPEQEKRRKIARLLGKAYHCARLEPDAFHERFVREISQADYANVEGFLGTATAIEAELFERGQPKKSKDDDGVLGQARRLAALGYEGPIWHILQAEWEAERHGRAAIPAEAFDQIEIDMQRIAAVPDVHAALSDGFAEVSILYDCPDTSLPMKARLDYLRGDGWAEFKSFANPSGKPLEQCLLDAIRFNGYYVDVAAYHEAVEAVRIGGVEEFFGDDSGRGAEMLLQIVKSPIPLPHRLIFQQKGGVPNVLSRSLRLFEVTAEKLAGAEYGRQIDTPPTMLMMKARAQIKQAKRTFVAYSEIYARGDPWMPWEPHRDVSDLDFSPHWLETV